MLGAESAPAKHRAAADLATKCSLARCVLLCLSCWHGPHPPSTVLGLEGRCWPEEEDSKGLEQNPYISISFSFSKCCRHATVRHDQCDTYGR